MQHPVWPMAGTGHPDVQRYRALRRPGVSPTEAAIEGTWALAHALAASTPVHCVFVCHELVRGQETYDVVRRVVASGRTAVWSVGRRLLDRMTTRDGPDGVAAIVEVPPRSLDSLHIPASARILIADRVEMAGNAGTLIRCADGAGASAVIFTDPRTGLLHPQSVKASMGTIFSMPIVASTATAAITWAKDHRMSVVAADPRARRSYRELSPTGAVAIVVGSERLGLSDQWRHAADQTVSIPMLGRADSLNVGHAAALLLYEALHRAPPQHADRTRR